MAKRFEYSWGAFTLKGEYKRTHNAGFRTTKFIYFLFHNEKLLEQTIGEWKSYQELDKEMAFQHMLPQEIQKEILLKAIDEVK